MVKIHRIAYRDDRRVMNSPRKRKATRSIPVLDRAHRAPLDRWTAHNIEGCIFSMSCFPVLDRLHCDPLGWTFRIDGARYAPALTRRFGGLFLANDLLVGWGVAAHIRGISWLTNHDFHLIMNR